MNAQPPAVPVIRSVQDSIDPQRGCLLGNRCSMCGAYCFPAQARYCRNPDCDQVELEEISLSRTGRIWSYTNASMRLPEPFPADEPFIPFAIAAVHLEQEHLLLLGPVVAGIGLEQLSIGMPMELVIERLRASVPEWIWKWRPVGM